LLRKIITNHPQRVVHQKGTPASFRPLILQEQRSQNDDEKPAMPIYIPNFNPTPPIMTLCTHLQNITFHADLNTNEIIPHSQDPLPRPQRSVFVFGVAPCDTNWNCDNPWTLTLKLKSEAVTKFADEPVGSFSTLVSPHALRVLGLRIDPQLCASLQPNIVQ
jgi:hypothetical protein